MDEEMKQWVDDYIKSRPEYLLSEYYYRMILLQNKDYHDQDFNREELLASYKKNKWNFEQNLRLRYRICTAYFMFDKNSSEETYTEMQIYFENAREDIIKKSIEILQSKKQV